MWSYLADLRAAGGSFHEHYNPFYDPVKHNSALLPPAAALAPTLWPQFYLRWTCPIESQGGDLESQWHAMNKKYAEAMKVIIYNLLLYPMQYVCFIALGEVLCVWFDVIFWELLLNKKT